MNKIIIVDIDNTLWDFASVLYEKLRNINPHVLAPEHWHSWDFWKGYMDAGRFYQVVNEIHLEQNIFGVYPEASDFLKELKKLGYRITIASHRSEYSRVVTVSWLDKYNLCYDQLYLTYDKTILFSQCIAVVDDSPHILSKAYERSLIATGLEFAWNRGNGFKLYKNLSQVLDFLKAEITP